MNRITIIIALVVQFLLAWWLEINPAKEYGWFMGFIHGGLFLPNIILSWFKTGWFIQAPIHTTMYMIDWWISAVIVGINWLAMILAALKGN